MEKNNSIRKYKKHRSTQVVNVQGVDDKRLILTAQIMSRRQSLDNKMENPESKNEVIFDTSIMEKL